MLNLVEMLITTEKERKMKLIKKTLRFLAIGFDTISGFLYIFLFIPLILIPFIPKYLHFLLFLFIIMGLIIPMAETRVLADIYKKIYREVI